MPQDTLQLHPEIDVLFYFPFNLGFSTAHVMAQEQGALFQKIADKLSRSYGDYSWSSVPYPQLIGTILEGGAYLRGLTKKARSPSHELIEKELRKLGGVLVGDVQEEVVYLAHGVGCVGLTLRIQIETCEALAELPQRTLRVIDALRTNPDALALQKDFKRFQDAMEHAFTEIGTLYDMWGILLRNQPRRGFIVCMSQAFILRTEEASPAPRGTPAKPPLAVPREQLPELLSPFTGFSAEENTNILQNSAGIEFCAEGWDGEVAVLSDPAREGWVRFFWMYATCSWSVLSDLNAYLYDQTRHMARNHTLHPKEARATMTATRRIQNAVSLLGHEAIPANIWDTQEQLAMHQGIFDSWGTEALLDGIKSKVEYLSEHYENLNGLLRDAAQERMNWIMTTFTFMTFSGVLADCIASIDFQGQNLTTPLRVFVIFMGTLGVIAISATVGYIMHSRRSLE